MKFHNETECRNFLEKLCESFNLCPKYCHLQTNVESCFHYQIKQCKGICREEEKIPSYNKRVEKAIDSIQFSSEHFVIKEIGREKNEEAFVLILNGLYKGFGFTQKSTKLTLASDYLKLITPQKDNSDVNRILKPYLLKNSKKIEQIENDSEINLFHIFAS